MWKDTASYQGLYNLFMYFKKPLWTFSLVSYFYISSIPICYKAVKKHITNVCYFRLQKQNVEDAPLFEQEQVQRAKRIMQPFVLRRLKTDVLRDLPTKTSQVVECAMESEQALKYEELCDQTRNDEGRLLNSMSVMMEFRRMANHPLTLRYLYQVIVIHKNICMN